MAANNDPKLIRTTALAKATQLQTRVSNLVATSVTGLSPSSVYTEGVTQLLSVNGATTDGGSWTCPAGVNYVQVECWGAGGGGGGGTSGNGGGGGGGGEYAAEQHYQVIPGNVYTYAIGRAGQGGVCGGQGGWAGGNTVFDTSGAGVTANGGLGGDGDTQLNGGSGSTNSVHYNGGNGAVSTGGVNSDNLAGISNVQFWWRMDDNAPPQAPPELLTTFLDASGKNRNGTPQSYVNSTVTVGSVAAPVQVPTKTTAGSPGTTKGNAPLFDQEPGTNSSCGASAPSFGFGDQQPAPNNGGAMTVSCWIRGNPALTAWGPSTFLGHNYVSLVNNCNWPYGLHGDQNQTVCAGFSLFLQNGQPGFYLCNAGENKFTAPISPTALSNTDNTWHQIVGTWDGTTARVYVDGALASSAAPGFGDNHFGPGPASITAGINAYNWTDSGFSGEMSNVWVSASTASGTYISNAYGGGSVPAAGSGGGASGGSAGPGNAGTSGSGTTGGAGATSAAGLANHGGSGAGGAGGNSAANGSNAPSSTPYGGGGGGAGKGSSLSTVNILSVQALRSATYMGLDSTHVPPGGEYSNSVTPQAGTPNPFTTQALITSNMYVGGNPGAPYNGSMNSVAVMPSVTQALAGLTVNSIQVEFAVLSTNASVLPVGFGVATDIPASISSDSDITTYLGGYTPLLTIPVPAGLMGRTVTFDITNSALITALKTQNNVVLVFGGLQGSPTHGLTSGVWSNDDAYAWNTVLTGAGADDPTTNLALNIETWKTSGSNTTAGDGAPGSLVISEVNTTVNPVATVQPLATTDPSGNTLAAGVTSTSVVGFDPTVSSPSQPETWHTLGTLSATGFTVSTARYRYAPDDGGTLVLQIALQGTASSMSSGANFSVTIPAALRPSVSSTAANDFFNFPLVPGGGPNVGTPINGMGVRLNGKNAGSPGVIGIVVGTTSSPPAYPYYIHVRIPIT